MTTPAEGERYHDLRSRIDLYLTSCRVEGKSPEAIRSYRETLGVFLQAIDSEDSPQDPASFAAAHVHPLVKVERESRQLFLRCWQELGLGWSMDLDGRVRRPE